MVQGLVYLAGAIDMVGGNAASNWREKVEMRLDAEGLSTFNPVGAFNYTPGSKHVAKALVEVNLTAITRSSFAIIKMSKKHNSVGTPIELYIASTSRIPHVVWWDEPMPPGEKVELPAYVEGLAHSVVFSMDDAIRAACHHHYRLAETSLPGVEPVGPDACVGKGRDPQ